MTERNKIICMWVYTIKLETKMLEFDYSITYDKSRIPISDKLKKKIRIRGKLKRNRETSLSLE
jgi:hypothetical protein